MRLEFLQADGDVAEFVTYLYEQGYALTHGCGQRAIASTCFCKSPGKDHDRS